jgi:hypothetical protein
MTPSAGPRRPKAALGSASTANAAAAAFIGHRDREDPVKWVPEGQLSGAAR